MAGLKHGNPQARVGKIEPGFRFGLTPGQGVPANAMYRIVNGVKQYVYSPSRRGYVVRPT